MATVNAVPPISRFSLIGLTIGVLICGAILISLGNWQLRRLSWKVDLMERVAERSKQPGQAAPGPEAWKPEAISKADYSPVQVTGRFLHEGEAHILTTLSQPRGRFGGPGYLVHTPFQTKSGWYVLINRGFIPGRFKDPGTRASELPEGEVTVKGLLRAPPPLNGYAPDAQVDKNIFYTRNVTKIAEARRLPIGRTAPYTIDLVASETPKSGLPQAGETRRTWTNNHLQYALTWYGLALALVGVYGAFVWSTVFRRKST